MTTTQRHKTHDTLVQHSTHTRTDTNHTARDPILQQATTATIDMPPPTLQKAHLQAAIQKIETLLQGGAQLAQAQFAEVEQASWDFMLPRGSFATATCGAAVGRNRYSDVLALEATRWVM